MGNRLIGDPNPPAPPIDPPHRSRFPILSDDANDAVDVIERTLRGYAASDRDQLALRVLLDLSWAGFVVEPRR